MKHLFLPFCILSNFLFLACLQSNAQSIGANTPFTSYEAESGALSGGATVVALTSPPTTEYSSPELEASGHAYVNLGGTGQSVLWTNNTGQAIAALNLRYSIPKGISNTIDLYVNGSLRGAIPVTSYQTWVYESATNYDGMSQTPYAGSYPHVFWDEAPFFVPGGSIPAGGTFSFQMDSGNTAAFYDIDVVDLETPPAPISQPTNSLSILDYGAKSNNPSFDSSTAIQNCINAAEAQNKIVWIPQGVYYVFNATLYPINITIQGAGHWYSEISCTKSGGHLFYSRDNASFKDFCLDSSRTVATPGIYGINVTGMNWVIDGIWSHHMTLVWGSGTNAAVQNCRVNNSWGDGIQLNNEEGEGCTNVLIYNNFVRGCGDDSIALSSSVTTLPPVWTATVKNNTTVASWWANQLGSYGGRNILIEDNLFKDCVKKTGMELNAGFNSLPPFGVTAINNTLIRCGSYGYAINQPGIIVEGGGTNITVADNVISNSMFEGVEIQSFWNLQFLTNTISSPGTTGIEISSGYSGSGNFQGNIVQGLNSGQVAFQNNSSTFAATLTNNSWQAIMLLSQNQPATASSYQAGNLPSYGNDGNLSTRWAATGAVYPSWWEVDLGTNYDLTSVVIDWYDSSSRAYGYQIGVSTDNVNFTNVVDHSGNTTLGNTTDAISALARYVMITVTSGTAGFPSFYEAQVFGTVPPTVALNPTNMLATVSGNVLTLAWPADHLGWVLQEQTNGLNATNWATVPGSGQVTSTNITIDPNNGSVFYRLFYQ